MKRLHFLSILLLLLSGNLCLVLPGLAQVDIQWEPMNEGLEGGQVDLLWRSPAGTFFAGGGRSGLFRSEARGQAWKPTTLTEGYVGIMTADSTGRIIAGTNNGIFVSLDDGLTWDSSSIEIPVYSLAVLPDGSVFAGTTEGIYRQKKAQNTWNLVGQWQLGDSCVNGFPVIDAISPVCAMTVSSDSTLIVAVEGSLFMTTDGDTWSCFNEVESNECLTFKDITTGSSATIGHLQATEDGFLVAVGGSFCSILFYDSNDRQFYGTGLSGGVSHYAASRSAVFAAMKGAGGASCVFPNGLYKSINHGRSWTRVAPTEQFILTVLVSADESWICVGSGGGVSCTEDEGFSWDEWNQGLANGEINTLFLTKGGDLLTGAMGRVWRTRKNSSLVWEYLSAPTPYDCLFAPSSFIQDEDDVLLASFGNVQRQIFRSNDDGVTWEQAPQNSSKTNSDSNSEYSIDGSNIQYCAVTGSHVYIGTSCPSFSSRQSMMASFRGYIYYSMRDVFRSNDTFNTEEKLVLNPLGLQRFSGMSMTITSGNTLLVSARYNVLRLEQDQQSWTLVYSGERTIQDMVSLDSGVILAATDRGILRSEDNGSTWSEIPLQGECFNSIESNAENLVVVDDKYMSIDAGLTWIPLKYEVPGQVYALAFDSEGILYAGTKGWGVYKSVLPVRTEVEGINRGNSFQAELFPNPAFDLVQVKMSMIEPRSVGIAIFDSMGRLRLTKAERLLVSGEHSVVIDISGIPSGVYLIRIRVDGGQIYLPFSKAK